MLVIDDSKLRLLKMKEKMLELSVDNFEETLDEYKQLALEIDKDSYQSIIEKIENSNYNNLPLEEQIEFFTEILEDYNYLNELQCNFRNTYDKYEAKELELSDLNKIMIDSVQARISQIEGYLINIKNLKSNKMELDNLNLSLIKATDEKEHVKEVILDIRQKLNNDVLNAKGRVYGTENNLEIISISSEFKNYGIDLKEIINNDEIINAIYSDFKKEKEEAEETLNIALSLPNKDDAICHTYAIELLKANYKFNLIELISEIYSNNNDYQLFKDNLYKIDDLIKEIKNGLKELNVKFYINPYDYIKIKDYIEIFDKFKDYSIDIENIKETITYLSKMIDNMENANNEFQLSINDDITILKDDDHTIEISIDTVDDKQYDIEEKEEISLIDNPKDNQVVKISPVDENFMIDRAKEKTEGVINRVHKMILESNEDVDAIVPELVIERKPDEMAEIKGVSDTDSLFQEVEPFVGPQLFDNRKDSEIFTEPSDSMVIDLSPQKVVSDLERQILSKDSDLETSDDKPKTQDLFWVSKDANDNQSAFENQAEVFINKESHSRR